MNLFTKPSFAVWNCNPIDLSEDEIFILDSEDCPQRILQNAINSKRKNKVKSKNSFSWISRFFLSMRKKIWFRFFCESPACLNWNEYYRLKFLKFKLSSICLWESFKRKSTYKRSLSMKVALLHFEFRGRMWIIAAIKTKTNHSHTRAAFVQHWAEEMESFDYISRNASGQRQIRDLTILFLLLNKTFTVFENNEKALFLRRNCNWGLFVFLLCKGVRPYLTLAKLRLLW